MSEQKSGLLPRVLIGVAIGAVAFVVYNRRTLFAGISGPRSTAQLPPDSGVVTVTVDGQVVGEGVNMDSTPSDTGASTSMVRSASTDIQLRARSLVGQIQLYIASARAQVDLAISEGQAEAARTRQELEERFAQAKKTPESARSAFQ